MLNSFIGPGSTRKIELITEKRRELGMATIGDTWRCNDPKLTWDEFIEPIYGHIDDSYFKSPSLFRGIYIESIKVSDGGWFRSPTYDDYVKVYAELECRQNEFTISVYGDDEEVNSIMAIYKEMFTPPNVLTLDTLQGFSHMGPIVDRKDYGEDDDINETGMTEFYPFLQDETLEEFAKRFEASSSNLIILAGPPGSGKTVLAQTMMRLLKRKKNGYVCNEEVIMSPGFPVWLSDFKDDSFVNIDDANRLIKKRDGENTKMAFLLNHLNGMVRHNGKMIITTNDVSVAKTTDSALLRHGRTFDVIELGTLTPEQANKARKAIGKEEVDLSMQEDYTLAEALNWEEKRYGICKEVETKFGFVS